LDQGALVVVLRYKNIVASLKIITVSNRRRQASSVKRVIKYPDELAELGTGKRCAMNTVWNTSAASAAEPNYAQAIGLTPAPLVVFAAVLANFGLCFVNTNVFKVNPSVVISCEIVLIAMAISLIWYRSTFFALFSWRCRFISSL